MRVLDRIRRDGGDGARALALVAASLIAIVGCGGDDDGDDSETAASATAATTGRSTPAPPTETAIAVTGASDEKLIRAAIKGALTSREPALACDRFATQAYVVSAYGDRAGCEAAIVSGGAAESVRISGIAVDGATATAVAVPSGGPSNGERLDVSLVREDETWKVDSLKSNVPVGP